MKEATQDRFGQMKKSAAMKKDLGSHLSVPAKSATGPARWEQLPENQIYKLKQVYVLWKQQNSIRLKASTQYRYTQLMENHILPTFGDRYVSEIHAPEVNEFLAHKLRTGRLNGTGSLSPSYVRSIMLVLDSVLRFAAQEKLCPPLSSKIYKPSLPARELEILNVQSQTILARMGTAAQDETELGILLALYTGMRIGEICALSWDDVDLTSKMLYVRHTVARVQSEIPGEKSKWIIDQPKTPSSLRCIPICSKLYVPLKAHSQSASSQYIVSKKPGFVSPRTFEYRFHSVLKRLGIPKFHFHVLRHTFATRCIESGVDVKTLSELLGHASTSVTLSTYVHSSMEMKRKQLEKLGF